MFCHLLPKKLYEKVGKKIVKAKAKVEVEANQPKQKNSLKFDSRKRIEWNGNV